MTKQPPVTAIADAATYTRGGLPRPSRCRSHTPVAQSQACRSVRSCQPDSFLIARQHARSSLSSVGGNLLALSLAVPSAVSVGGACLPASTAAATMVTPASTCAREGLLLVLVCRRRCS